jgi:redox-sensing transcriptional repressor
MSERRISEAVIRRLPKYYRQTKELGNSGQERISSRELSARMSLNASQVRQDLNCFGGFGQQGYGYQVKNLNGELKNILGLNRPYGIIIVGAGNIGQALAKYAGFEREGFWTIDIFDANPALVGKKVGDVVVRHIDDLENYSVGDYICIGIVATPKSVAQQMADKLVKIGVKAIWNFAPLDVTASVPVENANLSDGLYILTYRLTTMQNGNSAIDEDES